MKIIITLLSTLFIFSIVQAQSPTNQDEGINPEWRQKGDFVFGVYAGLSTNTLSVDNNGQFFETEDIEGNGFIVGLQAEHYFGKNWSIKGRTNFERRDYSLDITDNTLATSLQAAWHFGKSKRWHLALGPTYNAILNGNFDSDFGTDFSIGIIIPISNAKFFIELDGISQFNAGFISVTDQDGNPVGSARIDTNRSSINIGIQF